MKFLLIYVCVIYGFMDLFIYNDTRWDKHKQIQIVYSSGGKNTS
jgi:hypothetical protein